MLTCDFSDSGRGLVLKTGVRAGWRRLSKVFGFCEQVHLSSLRHSDLRIQVKVFPRYGVLIAAPPVFEDTSSQVQDISWVVIAPVGADGQPDELLAGDLVQEVRPRPVRWTVAGFDQLEVEVDLLNDDGQFNPNLRWKLSSTGAPTAHYVDHLWGAPVEHTEGVTVESLFGVLPQSQEYDLQILLVARPPALRRGPVERVWLQRHFVSGGLPELGKNR